MWVRSTENSGYTDTDVDVDVDVDVGRQEKEEGGKATH